jgi:type IV fimbrial biogenesis protein FimT
MRRRHLPSGFSLLELVIALALAAVMVAVATPNFAGLIARERLKSAAANLQADITLGRHAATQRGRTVHLVFQQGGQWCYAITLDPHTDCKALSRTALSPQIIKLVTSEDQPGISLLEAGTMALTPSAQGASAPGDSGSWGSARFASPTGQQMQLVLGPLGRATVCAPAMPVPGITPCAAQVAPPV